MAYCWDQHSGLTYLKREDAGICVSSEQELKSVLHQICCDTSMICDYSHKAYLCGQKNHNRQHVQEMLLEDFKKYIATSGGYYKE